VNDLPNIQEIQRNVGTRLWCIGGPSSGSKSLRILRNQRRFRHVDTQPLASSQVSNHWHQEGFHVVKVRSGCCSGILRSCRSKINMSIGRSFDWPRIQEALAGAVPCTNKITFVQNSGLKESTSLQRSKQRQAHTGRERACRSKTTPNPVKGFYRDHVPVGDLTGRASRDRHERIRRSSPIFQASGGIAAIVVRPSMARGVRGVGGRSTAHWGV